MTAIHTPAEDGLPQASAAGPAQHTQGLGDQESIWFKLTALQKGTAANPMTILQQLTQRYGGVIAVTMANERVVFLSEPDHFKRVLVTNPAQLYGFPA